MPAGEMVHRGKRGARPPRIVVTEDTRYLQDLIGLLLRLQGFETVGAADGEAALEMILSEGADGLVSDLEMPGLDGLRLCRVLRALRASAALPIVVFTGVDEDDVRLSPIREMDAVRILHKPQGLHDIAPALLAMMPTAVTGHKVRTISPVPLARTSLAPL
jgi:DNA-binding response OmpR family regulator